jgi:hypothetical protein
MQVLTPNHEISRNTSLNPLHSMPNKKSDFCLKPVQFEGSENASSVIAWISIGVTSKSCRERGLEMEDGGMGHVQKIMGNHMYKRR